MRTGVAVFLVLVAGACEPRQGWGPTLDEAVAEPNRWPVCISQHMIGQAAQCPAARKPAAATASCAPRAPTRWPDGEPASQTSELSTPQLSTPRRSTALAAAMRGRSPALDRAEARFDQAERDGDWSRLERAYLPLLGQRRSELLGYVHLAIGHIRLASSDFGRAADAFELGARFAMDNPSSPEAAQVESESRRALIAALTREPASADERFAKLHDQRVDRRATTMSESLAMSHAGAGKLDDAARVLHILATRDREGACRHRSQVVRLRQRIGDREATVRALDALFDELDARAPDSSEHDACGAEAARLSLEVADGWHDETLGTSARAGTRDARTMYLASHVYRSVLASVSQRQLDRWGVCAPLADVAFARADLLLAQQRWGECGPAYDLAIHADPTGARAEQASFEAVVCRQNAWTEKQRMHASMGELQRIEAQLDHSDDWRTLLRSIHRYLCMAEATQGDTPSYAESAYVRAQAFYDGGALWESAVAFRLVAFDHPGARAGGRAAQRYAEVMEPLAADDACRNELTIDVQRLFEVYCSDRRGRGPRKAGPREPECQGIASVLGRLRRHRLQL